MNWTAQQKIRLGFWLLTLVPVVFGALAARNAYDLVSASRNVAVTNEVGRRLERLLSELKDIEVAQREFILIGGRQPLQTIADTRTRIEEDSKYLRSAGADPRWLDMLDELIPQKIAEIQKTVDLRRDSGLEAASRELLTNRGHQAIDDIRVVVRHLMGEEARRLESRSEEQQTRFERTLDLFALVLLLNIALIWLLYFLQRGENLTARRLNEELERRVAIRTEALQRSNEDLQQFAYIASHDLKEPLRMISSYTTLLQRRYAGRLDEDADAFINFIVDGVRRMNTLIQDVLEYSRAGAGKDEQYSDVNVSNVLRSVLANLKVTIAESGASVTWDKVPEVVPYDAVRLAQIFQNLIGNGIKYRAADRRPVIKISCEKREEEIIFSVRDNGIGIEPEYIDKIFGIFQRLHGKEYEGTGIGLAMVKKIVERHGGRIWVESKPGVGSTFCFTVLENVPAAIAEAASTTST
jgi:signal transduction histidine kinase